MQSGESFRLGAARLALFALVGASIACSSGDGTGGTAARGPDKGVDEETREEVAAPGEGAASGAAPAPGADAGSSSVSGAEPTSDGGARVSATEMSLRQVCLAYVRASCHRQLECRRTGVPPEHFDDSCGHLYDDCPDLLFAEGSQREAEEALACAEQWKTFDCEQVKLLRVPDCELPGTHAVGEPCISRHQCEVRACVPAGDPDHPACRHCPTIAEVGGACDRAGVACPAGQECDNGSCRDVETLPGVSAKQPGELCWLNLDYCLNDAACLQSPDAPLENTCQPLPRAGQACARRQPSDQEPACGPGLYCDQTSTCTALPAAGQPCGVTVSTRRRCGPDASCDAASLGETGTCIARVAGTGERCVPGELNPDMGCVDGLICVLPDPVVSNEGVCTEDRLEGQPCDGPGLRCEQNTACEAGICKAPQSLELLQARCN